MKTLRLLLVAFALEASAATITVNSTSDVVAVDGACTFREAVTAANTNAVSGDCPAGTPGLDQIHFAIAGGGAQTIYLSATIGDIVDPVTIDATTQPGYAGTPLITLYGSYFQSSTTMFVVPTAGGGSTFRGLILGGGGTWGTKIELRSSGNTIAGNYIGTDGTTGESNNVSIHVIGSVGAPASKNVIGGLAAADRNVVAGASAIAIGALTGGIADGNSVLGNYVGWNAEKTRAIGGLGQGIAVSGATNTTIRGNSVTGVSWGAGISIGGGSGTVVQSNEIGAIGFGNLDGIRISGATNTIIGATTSGAAGGNVIMGNGSLDPDRSGVFIFHGTSSGIRISGNSMSRNGLQQPPYSGLGIDLFPYGRTPNDPCDADAGPNGLQNKPVLTGAVAADGTILVQGSLNSKPAASYTIEFYANPPDAGDQGYRYIGAATVTTDAACNATFTSAIPFVPPARWTITATAIDAENNTSEMSAPAVITALAAPTVTKQFNPATIQAGSTTRLTITLTNPNAFAITGTAFTDQYPAGLTNAFVPNVANSCGGAVTALPAGSALTLSGGVIPPNGTCSVSVSVVAGNEGSFVNTLPAGSVTSANAPPSAAGQGATLTASAVPNDVPLSPAALMLLAVALAMVGTIALRQITGG
jgi:uncharacterized repeat protein (TIGR01451 family)